MRRFASIITIALVTTTIAAEDHLPFADPSPRGIHPMPLQAHTQCYTVTNYGANKQMSSHKAIAFQEEGRVTFKGKSLRKKLSKCPTSYGEVLNSSDETTFNIDSGDGVCSTYNADKSLGACLYSGTDATSSDPTSGGWVSWPQPANCGRKIVAWMDGQAPVEMPVVDGCTFFTTDDPKASCPGIAFTLASFLAVAGSEQVMAVNDGHLSNVHWTWVDQPN